MRKWQTPGVLGSLRQMLLSQMPKILVSWDDYSQYMEK